MTIWVARAGKSGERESKALEDGRAFVGWSLLSDLSNINTREDIQKILEENYPDKKANTIKNNAGQLYNFIKEMQIGDYFALPMKSRPAIAFGKIVGPYEYLANNPEDTRHSRKIEWIGDPLPRSKFDQDILYSFGSALTVFTVKRNNAESRILNILNGTTITKTPMQDEENSEENTELDIEYVAKEQISDFIGRKFKGHAMENLVAEVLKAQGYVVRVNERKGADGGADILAGKGDMGFGEPSICVQVKSSDSAVGLPEYNELKGVMQKFDAVYGLLVSWGGFKSTVEDEARRDFFHVRLWTGEDLVNEIQENYHNLSSDWHAEIPLQQVWTLVDSAD